MKTSTFLAVAIAVAVAGCKGAEDPGAASTVAAPTTQSDTGSGRDKAGQATVGINPAADPNKYAPGSALKGK